MSNFWVGVVAGIGAGGWIYAKLMRSTGNNTKNALTGAAIGGAITCLVVTTLFSVLFS